MDGEQTARLFMFVFTVLFCLVVGFCGFGVGEVFCVVLLWVFWKGTEGGSDEEQESGTTFLSCT